LISESELRIGTLDLLALIGDYTSG